MKRGFLKTVSATLFGHAFAFLPLKMVEIAMEQHSGNLKPKLTNPIYRGYIVDVKVRLS